MALIHWKQIDGDLSGSRVLTGSLVVSGTISADEFIGIDPTAIFTGSISASVSPTGNVFTIKSGSSDLVTVDENGNVVVEGSLTAQEFYTEIVSASILFESGSSLFGNSLDDTHQFTGSLLVSGSGGHQISGSLYVQTNQTSSTAIISNNTTVGYPTSNNWQDSLDGSYFDNFNHDTHISEILRFMAGVMSSSLDVAAPTPNTKTWGSTSASYTTGNTNSKSSVLRGVLGPSNTGGLLSNDWRMSSYIDSTKTGSFEQAQEYFISKGFLKNSETGSDHVGTNPFYYPHFSRVPNTILRGNSLNTLALQLSANATGTTVASSNSNYFGLGSLTNGQATNTEVKVYATQSFSDNYSDAVPDETSTFSVSGSNILSNNQFGTNDGITLSKIITTQPAVIPSAFQDGDFTVPGPLSGRKYSTGENPANNISASGYYRMHDAAVGLKTGSQSEYTTQTVLNSPTSFYMYIDDVATDITTGERVVEINSQLTRTGITATSRSLSGAPYLLTTNYTYVFLGEVSGSFDPGYSISTNPLYIHNPVNTWDNIGTISSANINVGVGNSGVEHSTSKVGVVSADKNTQRSIGDIPNISDICFATSSLVFNLNSNVNNTQQTRYAQQQLNYNLSFQLQGRNWRGNQVVETSNTQVFYDYALFGQSKTTIMAIYSRAQGYDAGSLTGTTEEFSGEDHRIQLNNNVLTFNGTAFNTAFDLTELGTYDLQVKPGYLVEPGGNYGYWYDSGFKPANYKYYIRRFRTTGAKTRMSLNIGTTLQNWSSSSNGVAATILFKSSGDGSGSNNSLSTARLFDPSELNSNVVESAVSADNFKNPFTDDLDLYGNTGGTKTGTTYDIPLRNADGMYLDNSDNEFYVIIRYRGDQTPITNITTSTS